MTDTPASTRTHHGPILVEWVTLAYTLFTTLLIVLFWSQMGNPLQLLEGRGMVVGGMALLWLFYHLRPNKYILLLRYIFPLSLLGYWYPDTYEFCQLFPNLDYLFAAADHALFGCQPSITFAQWLPQKVWSELFHMGYFAYYPLIFLTVLAPLFTDRSQFSRTASVVLASFFLYYLIYLFLFVIGVPANIMTVVTKSPLLLVLTAIMVCVNMLFCFFGAKLFKCDLEDAIIASNANIGGPTTAAGMAISQGWTKLVGPAMLVGVLGYVVGNYMGTIVGIVLGA